MKEGIQLPTIVVVGDQSSGKSSVLESLAGISLPRGQGICTRVPLIMRLQDHHSDKVELQLEYESKTIQTSEARVSDAINVATEEIAGTGKGISHTPLTLVVRKKGVPDLTMIDLPGITRVPVHGQPEDIYEQISNIIKDYISPKESIILNVLSATVDFPTCESIRMSQLVDKTGERTLAVVTKSDRAPEGLLEKVTTDAINIGLGYVCVRNRIGDESYEEARTKEAELFESHPLLSKIDKSIVGIPVLAQKLVEIQAASIARCLPEIVKKINDKLNQNVDELSQMPQNLASAGDAMKALFHITGAAKDSLKKILLQGEFEEYPEDKKMHCTARMADMLHDFSNQLYSKSAEDTLSGNFLIDEIKLLEESEGIGLPNFIPRTVFLVLLQRKVDQIAVLPLVFMTKMWSYIEDVVGDVLTRHLAAYPQLKSATIRATQNLLAQSKKQSENHVRELVQMEMIADYTSNPEYMKNWASLMAQRDRLMEVIRNASQPSLFNLNGFGQVQVGHLRQKSSMVEQAFDIKMRVTVYWKIVVMRLVDSLAMHLLFSLQKLVNHDMLHGIVDELMGPQRGGIERMLEESPSLAGKRERMNRSIKLLKQSKDVVANIMDRISADGQFDNILFQDQSEA
ncbi:dynamin-related protein 4C [Cinnamomum micranthum f. kanehirae]|uniref:Dynamin-related protein 4C n=1 Tax=Cinnamomum micranthum f. kanehirae TaxID=337451 RepID=A0A3S3MJQ5_9MAGN|nr:dynamin-related protein 4C [Cinnamomum micranthum f. kanehirae]